MSSTRSQVERNVTEVRPLRVLLCSTSDIKRLAVLKVFPNAEITCINAPSGVPKQPIDFLYDKRPETETGANNRLENAFSIIKDPKQRGDVVVSIENGLRAVGHTTVDYAQIVVAIPIPNQKIGKVEKFSTFSAGMPVPTNVYNWNWERQSKRTWAEATKMNDPKDPHLEVCGISRIDIIADALRVLAGTVEELKPHLKASDGGPSVQNLGHCF